jgi:hypothetical protein
MMTDFILGYILFGIFLSIFIRIWYNKITIKTKQQKTDAENYVIKLSRYIYTTIHYDMNELYEIYELQDMNRIYEINNKITDLHKTYYKTNNYTNVLNLIKSRLISIKQQELLLQMNKDIKKQKLLISKKEYNELKIMKFYGLKTDMEIYKTYLKKFFKSLNDLNEIIICK